MMNVRLPNSTPGFWSLKEKYRGTATADANDTTGTAKLKADSLSVEQLREEKEELERRFERQRASMEHLLTLVQACRDPLETLPDAPSQDKVESLTSEEATLLTITNLRNKIADIEDKREEQSLEMLETQATNERLALENEAQRLKIETLERLLGEEHKSQHISSMPDPDPSDAQTETSQSENYDYVTQVQFENTDFFGANAAVSLSF